MTAKLPAFQFYPADWRKDVGVQSLSYHDRGVWHEILCLMHESEQRGKLLLNGQPMPTEVLARILGLDKQSLEQTIERLISYGVARSDDKTGALMNKRMVEDETERQANAARQRKFYNNKKEDEKPNAKPNANLTAIQQNSNDYSSSSSSVTEKKKKKRATASKSPPLIQEKKPPESQKDYLARKQVEYPLINVESLFVRFCNRCRDEGTAPTRRRFDVWLENEEPPLELPEETPSNESYEYRDPYSGATFV